MNSLGPFEADTIVCGDALEIMRQMPGGCVDLVVTDPPYNIKKASWDDIEDYIQWSTLWLTDAMRLLRPHGSIYVMASHQSVSYLYMELDNLALWHNTIIWHYTNGLGSNTHFSIRYEPILFFSKTDNYYFNVDPLRTKDWAHGRGREKGYHPKGRNPTDVWQINRLVWNNPERVNHPTQKPLELFRRMIVVSSSAGDLIFDPFIGSGTTAVAAKKLGRHWFGCDISPGYVRLANERVAKVQPRLL